MALTSKVRALKQSWNPIHKMLQQEGYKDIIKWIILATGGTAGSATEISAPTATFLGDVEEVTSIVFAHTKAQISGAEYLSIPHSAAAGGSTSTMHYFWASKPEITTVTFSLTKAAMTDASTFVFEVDDGDSTVTPYYVWFDKTGTTGDPSGTGTGIEADISASTSAIDVATVVEALIHAKADVACTRSGAVLTITNANNGIVVDAAEEIAGTGTTFAIDQGTDDPSATGTGHAVDISTDTTAANVADAFNTIINGVAGITSSVSTATVTVESDNSGSITDVTQSSTHLGTITVTNQGRAYYEGAYLYVVSSSASDINTTAGHVRKVKILGFDHNDDFVIEEVSLAGTTVVKTATRFTAIISMYASLFGTGGTDAVGNITVETSATANCTALLTIAANGTESGGARIYVPKDNFSLFWDMEVSHTTNANTGSTIITAKHTGFDSKENTDSDSDTLTASVNAVANHSSDVKIARQIRTGSETAVITFFETEAGTEGNETAVVAIEVWTFKEQ